MKIIKNDEAVSPVIGVILMVAITVILAAVIAAFVFGMAGTTSTTKNVGVTIALDQNDHAAVTLSGGSDLPQLNNMSYKLNGTATDYGFVERTGTGTYTTGIDADNFPMGVGSMLYSSQDVITSKISVIGYFKDGSTQVLVDRQF